MLSRRASFAQKILRASSNHTELICFQRRLAHHEAPQFNEPSGNLFGEKPLPPGQKRKREDWEMIWYIGMFGSMAVAAIGLYAKPDTSIQAWALQEAKRRMDESGEKYRYESQSPSSSVKSASQHPS